MRMVLGLYKVSVTERDTRRGLTDPFVVWLVQGLVEHGVVEYAMDPVYAVVGEGEEAVRWVMWVENKAERERHTTVLKRRNTASHIRPHAHTGGSSP